MCRDAMQRGFFLGLKIPFENRFVVRIIRAGFAQAGDA